MNPFFESWFQGFDKGLEQLSTQECARLFSECAAQCGKDALKCLYQDLFNGCEGNMDEFFSSLGELNGVDGRVIENGSVYEIIFKSCGCDLHTKAKVNSSRLCECSRQSILWILRTLVPDRAFSVERMESILQGDQVCRFRIRDITDRLSSVKGVFRQLTLS